ncbi:hypothetical protein G6L30_17150 [Agrobacterium rhizogenes]|nr:hypothetical protein [Rhizobium rhizogenes]
MSAFINGPFKARNNGSYWQIDDKDGLQVGDACAATVDGYDDNGEVKKYWERGEAVATMLAAAPSLLEALRPFALVYEKDISVHEDDADLFQVMHAHNRAPKLTVGDFRKAYNELMIAEGRS